MKRKVRQKQSNPYWSRAEWPAFEVANAIVVFHGIAQSLRSSVRELRDVRDELWAIKTTLKRRADVRQVLDDHYDGLRPKPSLAEDRLRSMGEPLPVPGAPSPARDGGSSKAG